MNKTENATFIHPLRVLQDNIIWILIKGQQAVVIDPGVSAPVKDWLKDNSLNLLAILQTHHHEDHIGGTQLLKKFWPRAEVFAPEAEREQIPFQTKSLKGEEELSLLGMNIKVLNVNGHTKGHIAYFISQGIKTSNPPILFCGDTLFGGGCGRVFEGTMNQMYQSLQLLKELPLATKIYCAHEYTESNLIWALSIQPNNILIQKRLLEVKEARLEGKLSLPSTICEEKSTNLFLTAKSLEEFKELRTNKDNWNG